MSIEKLIEEAGNYIVQCNTAKTPKEIQINLLMALCKYAEALQSTNPSASHWQRRVVLKQMATLLKNFPHTEVLALDPASKAWVSEWLGGDFLESIRPQLEGCQQYLYKLGHFLSVTEALKLSDQVNSAEFDANLLSCQSIAMAIPLYLKECFSDPAQIEAVLSHSLVTHYLCSQDDFPLETERLAFFSDPKYGVERLVNPAFHYLITGSVFVKNICLEGNDLSARRKLYEVAKQQPFWAKFNEETRAVDLGGLRARVKGRLEYWVRDALGDAMVKANNNDHITVEPGSPQNEGQPLYDYRKHFSCSSST